MATRTATALRQPNAESPDAPYAVVAGLYVAALFAPVVVLLLSRATSDGAILYVGFLAAVTSIATVAGWRVSRTPGLAIRFGRRTTTWLLAVLPFAWFVGVLGIAAIGGEPPDVAALLAIVGTGGGMFLGLILTGMSRNRYAAAVLTDTEEMAEWEARWPRRWRRLSIGGMVVACVAGVGGVIVQLVWSDWHWAGYLYFLIFLWTPFAGAANPRTFRVTDAGLFVERPLQRRFRPWSAFAGYSLTDDALVVRPTAWWRPAYRCDRTDIEDVEAAVAALDDVFRDNR